MGRWGGREVWRWGGRFDGLESSTAKQEAKERMYCTVLYSSLRTCKVTEGVQGCARVC